MYFILNESLHLIRSPFLNNMMKSVTQVEMKKSRRKEKNIRHIYDRKGKYLYKNTVVASNCGASAAG